jgi:hypothetical protein
VLNYKTINMKNIITIAFICGIIFSLSVSCQKGIGEFLDKAPGIDVTEDTIFSSKTQIETFVAGTYLWGLHSPYAYNDARNSGVYIGDMSVDCDEGKAGATWLGGGQWPIGSIISNNSNGDGRQSVRWNAIRRCNILIERIESVSNIEQSYKDQVKGEALFIRALNYFEMLKRYGGIPKVDKRFLLTDSLFVKRSTIAESFNFIVKDCDNSALLLPPSYVSTLRGRATKGAALALKAKALLYAASPIFNAANPYLDAGTNNSLICYGNYDINRWQKAADAAQAVLDWASGSGCVLVTNQGVTKNYKFVWEKPDNSEIILAEKAYAALGWWVYPWRAITPTNIVSGWGGRSVPMNFVKLYEKIDGTSQNWNMVSGGNDLNQKYAELDPRFAQTIAYNGTYWSAEHPIVQTFAGGLHVNTCFGGAWVHKAIPSALGLVTGTSQIPNGILFRLGEVYLTLAEALNEAQGPVAAAYNAVNTIRARSGMPNLQLGLSKEQFRTRIRNERSIELAYEDQRFYDIRRWLIAENDGVMKGNFYGIKIAKIAGTTPQEYSYSPYVFEVRSFTPKMYLHPWPINEVNKGYIIQNPGY